MKRLYVKTIEDSLKRSRSYQELLKRINGREWPIPVTGIRGPLTAALIARLNDYFTRIMIVTPTEKEGEELRADLELHETASSLFPGWGTMMYRGVSPQAVTFGRRSAVLAKLLAGERETIIVPLRALTGFLPDPEAFRKRIITFKTDRDINLAETEKQLVAGGYFRTHRVSVPGEFALRGEVLDIYPVLDTEQKQAVRIVFSFDRIEEIRLFEPENQTSVEKRESITLPPFRESDWPEERLASLENRCISEGWEHILPVIEELREGREVKGDELLFTLSFGKTWGMTDYCGGKTLWLFLNYEYSRAGEETMQREYEELYRDARQQKLPVPHPRFITRPLAEIEAEMEKRIVHNVLQTEESRRGNPVVFSAEPPRSWLGNITWLKSDFENLIGSGYTLFVFSDSESQGTRIQYLLKEFPVKLVISPLTEGFFLPDEKIGVIQENEIFGRKRRPPASVKKSRTQIIDSFIELEPGDYVVHLNHGIGLFRGIKRIKAAGHERDYISLEYGGDEMVYLPIEQVNMVQRYIGQGNRKPQLDKIGGSSWNKKKTGVMKSVEDLADRLIVLYAKRQTAQGFTFPVDNDFQVEFEADFPWEETEDQLRAIADVKRDMESPRPMDRLVCGDVGYGKTEIAMRAAFKAVLGGRQVAFLCPTTILAEQHFENFQERFKRFPVRIGMLSRFVGRKDQKLTLEKAAKGDLDIIIGTHRLLSADVKFRNMGLLVIDEEQRFGVKDKERLKELKSSLDCLTLSATPIPRTLHMSLAKIRDLSLLLTPPYNRHPIETFIEAFNEDLVARAIRREVERDGQIFFLHNRVESLEAVKQLLQALVPEVMIETAHGQMDSRDLEDIMHRFIHRSFHVLISTTIIESGIDIPNVNTIIIDRADMYGVSQLYQLRGRVGRSDRVAYAYLMYPEDRALSELAMKRLQVISDFTELGSGFKIAMKDLEVRGAGNLLGREQSGDIFSVGFDMYLHLLEDAINTRLSDGTEENPPEPYLELEYSGYLPDSYISDPGEKMEIYKKIAGAITDDDLSVLHAEIFDRFGPLPDEAESLLSLAEIRIICRKLWIASLKEKRGLARIEFGKVARLSIDKVMKLVRGSGDKVKLDPQNPSSMILKTGEIGLKEKSEFIKDHLSRLL
jgi:transcription-repair coupling factor (superfamily II helicase)